MIATNETRIDGRNLGDGKPIRCGAFVAARGHRPSINVRIFAPRTPGITMLNRALSSVASGCDGYH
jgi:hypothetical protein